MRLVTPSVYLKPVEQNLYSATVPIKPSKLLELELQMNNSTVLPQRKLERRGAALSGQDHVLVISVIVFELRSEMFLFRESPPPAAGHSKRAGRSSDMGFLCMCRDTGALFTVVTA